IPIAELPLEIVAGDELPETRVKWRDVVVLEIHLDERFPVVVALVDLDAVEHVAGEVEGQDIESREVTVDIARAVEEEAVPVLDRRAVEVGARLFWEIRRPG